MTGTWVWLASTVALMCALLLPISPLQAGAQEVEAGWEAEEGQGYIYGKLYVPRWLDETMAVVASVGVNHFYLSFPDEGGSSRLSSPAGAVMVGLRFETERWGGMAGPGYELRRTSWHPAGDSLSVYGEHGVTAYGEGWMELAPLTYATSFVHYAHAARYLWVRAGAERQVNNSDYTGPVAISLGLDVTLQRDPEDRAYQVGPLVGCWVVPLDTYVELRGGVSRWSYSDGSREHRPYLGVTLYRAF